MTTTLTHRIQDERLAAGLTLVVSAIALAFANFAGSGENGGIGPYAVCLALVAVVAAVLYGRVLPGVADPARAGWILGGTAIVSGVVAFWSGLPFVLGFAAIYAGARAGRVGPQAVGIVAVVLSAVACVIG